VTSPNRQIIIELNDRGSLTLDALCADTGLNPSTVMHQALLAFALLRGMREDDGTVVVSNRTQRFAMKVDAGHET
jgi:hypothetical protein